MNVLVFGEVLWDLIEGEEHLGGAAFNLAAHLAQMGGEVTLLSAVGDDALGREVLERAAGFGIDTTGITIHGNLPTGTVDVRLDDRGQPDYTIHEGVAWDSIELTHTQFGALAGRTWDAICIGTLAQRSEGNRILLLRLLGALRRRHVFYDVNLRQSFFTAERVERSLLGSTIVKINDDEAVALSAMLFSAELSLEKTARRLLTEFGLDTVIVTRGGEGAFVLTSEEELYSRCGIVDVVDTVGAGDSFSAGFLYAYLNGAPLKVSVDLASGTADFVVSHTGAIPEYTDEVAARFATLRDSIDPGGKN